MSTSSNEYAIRIKRVSKRFKLYDNPITGPIKEYLRVGRKKPYREFKAVSNVDLDVKKGEVIGIIGPNGSGKTTLLKMVAGLLPVDEGTIEINGKVTALLALGVGVHPEFSGRENIYYGGLLLGMGRDEVLSKMEDIIEFAELGPFIDQPFRTYSSGMKARLLFSISMSIDPDILVVDEALSTGDDFFIQKSMRKIRELCESGATILFVSHNLIQVQALCNKAILLERGQIVNTGQPADIIQEYQERAYSKDVAKVKKPSPEDRKSIAGTGEARVTNVRILDSHGNATTSLRTGNNCTIEINYESDFENKSAEIFIGFVEAKSGRYVGEITSYLYINDRQRGLDKQPIMLQKEGTIHACISNIILLNNHYNLWVILQSSCIDRTQYCEYKNLSPFFIARPFINFFERGPVFWQPCSFKQP